MPDQKERLEAENNRLHRLLKQAGLDAAASDVTDRLQKALIAELHHRIKNLLAMVLSITTQTLKGSRSLAEAQEAVRSRIMALSRSHDLLIGSEEAAPLRALIENAVAPFDEDRRFAISVPDIAVAAPTALSLSLMLNELCTNAATYGSLSQAAGGVEIRATTDADTLTMVWTEVNGPPVEKPQALGFGTSMIKAAIPDAVVRLDFRRSGLVCRMRVALAALA
jgi:two-component sensor histidine kinase